MWLSQVIRRLSVRNRKQPKFREIVWSDDGEVQARPPTRGKQFAPFGFTAPTMDPRGRPSLVPILSNVSHKSQAPLLTPRGPTVP
ncbi:hypothetical protein QBC42DRAFT_259988 [Cladorrhinum samala]|uniref:Uncharacterized protein n=1 Tax=Cladorrhinum samala TaxID=585594 RepID=A0AAV9HYY5_9PEZI|nr:hypothetical protein QBC42DRAFT_259988 [Cladorrhinum samala]